MVGAVIVKDGKVIGKGWHQKYRSLHAEREALANCRQSAKDATLYVTLEPCCHHGNQPPCTEAILESGIKEVVVGCLDPNPLVAGKGIEILKIMESWFEMEFLNRNADSSIRPFFIGYRPVIPTVP